MGKSRAEYMRVYRQKKREEKLKSGKVEPKKIAKNSTQRSRDWRARARNSTLSQTSTAENCPCPADDEQEREFQKDVEHQKSETSQLITIELPSNINTKTNSVNKCPTPNPLQTEEVMIKLEPVDDQDSRETKPNQNIMTVEQKTNNPYNIANFNNQESESSQLITIELPSLVNTKTNSVNNESPAPNPLQSEVLKIKLEPIDNLDGQRKDPIQKEESWPKPISVLKHEALHDDDDERILPCSDDKDNSRPDLSKIMLHNVLQNMFVTKEQRPAVATDHQKTVKPAPTETTVTVKSEITSPEPLLTEEMSIKLELVDDLHNHEPPSSQDVTLEVPASADTTVPVKNEAACNEENYKIDLNRIMLQNVLQNMFVAKPPVPVAEEVSQSADQPRSLLRQLLYSGQKGPITETASNGYRLNKIQVNTKTAASVPVPAKHGIDGVKKKMTDNSNRPYNFQCTECGKKFRDKFYIRRHVESVHLKFLETCDICNKSVGAYNIRDHMEMHKKGVYCEPCQKWFCLSSYKAHMRTSMFHVRPEHYRFACDECGQKFHRKVNLTRHLNREHLKKEKPYKCGQCLAAYQYRRSLDSHLKYVHERNERPRNFICDHCGAAFYKKGYLASHMVRHTGVRPYKCNICGAAYGYSVVLATHVKLKHGDAGTKEQPSQESSQTKI